jgi:hypothetical protein
MKVLTPRSQAPVWERNVLQALPARKSAERERMVGRADHSVRSQAGAWEREMRLNPTGNQS